MSFDVTGHLALPSDGFRAVWTDGEHDEELRLSWENEAWTAVGAVAAADVEYVVRITAQWRVSQFLLFRDLADADLWLGTDGRGRWGEVNGAHRPDLDGATDIVLRITPFAHAVPIRRLPLPIGDGVDLQALGIDVDTLGVVRRNVRYERLGERRWRHTDGDDRVEFDVDRYGVPEDVGRFSRTV